MDEVSVKNFTRGVGGIVMFSVNKLFLVILCPVGDFCFF